MPTTPSNAPALNHTDTHQKAAGFQDVRFQAGKIVTPEDLNDLQDIIRQDVNRLRDDLGMGGGARAPNELAIVPVSFEAASGEAQGTSLRNYDNLAITIGRIHTPLGLIDTSIATYPTAYDEDDKTIPPVGADTIIYDWLQTIGIAGTGVSGLGDLSIDRDRGFANYMFRGTVTAAGDGNTTSLVDENKKFGPQHRLTGFSASGLTQAGTTIFRETIAAISHSDLGDGEMAVEEPPCRIYFVGGANDGVVRAITGVTSETELTFSSLPNSLNEGDEYYIVPGNSLIQARSFYDAQSAANTLNANRWFQLPYILAWKEDISANEDDSIRQPDLDADVTHRTQMRWALRILNFQITATGTNAVLARLHALSKRMMLSGDGWVPAVHEGDAAEFNQASLGLSQIVTGGDATIHSNADIGDNHLQFPKPGGEGRWGAVGIGLMNLLAGFGLLQRHPKTINPRPHPNITNNFEMSPRDVFDAARFQLQLLVDETATSAVAIGLCMFWAQAKALDGETLSPIFFPADDNTYLPDSKNPRFSYIRYYEPPPVFMPLPQATLELVQAKRMGYHSVLDNRWLGLIDQDGTYDFTKRGALLSRQTHDFSDTSGVTELHVPLSFSSVGEHLTHLDALVMGGMGLLGVTELSDGTQPPSALVQLVANATDSTDTVIGAAGQQPSFVRATFTGTAPEEMNPLAATDWKAFGTVRMLDPLADNTDNDYETQFPPGDSMDEIRTAFARGPAKYYLRDGLEVTSTGQFGWGFHRLSGSSRMGNMDITPRAFHEGIAQATAMREALNFRKLAIKTSVSKSMDMFNYWIGRPDLLRTPLSGDATIDYSATTATPYMAVGAIQNLHPSQHGNLALQNRSSYSGYSTDDTTGGLVGGSPTRSPWKAEAPRPKNANSGEPAFDTLNGVERDKGSRAVENIPASPDSDLVFMNTSTGPWGRYPINSGDTDSPDDLWTNRCTAMRLRYHIGDFYPGPNGETGRAVNALVDTLKLFVRIEPLSLVHWATMPRHQHSLLEDSVSFQDAMQEFINWMRGYGISEHLLDSSGRPRLTALSPAMDGFTEGDVNTHSMPFANKHQPYVHWFHPLMEYLTAPHPVGEVYPENATWGTEEDSKYSAYKIWGERSLIIPAITYEDNNPTGSDVPANPATGSTMGDIGGIGPSDAGQPGAFTDDYFSASPSEIPNATSAWTVDALGSHKSVSPSVTIPGASVSSTVEGQTIEGYYHERTFPFIPKLPDVLGYDGGANIDLLQVGLPGPVFIPAYRKYLSGINDGGDDTDTRYGFNPVFHVDWDDLSTAKKEEYDYFPSRDGVFIAGNDDVTHLLSEASWTGTNTIFTKSGGNSLPVLRSAIRTDTVAQIVDLVRTTFEFKRSGVNLDLDTYPTSVAIRQPGSGPDVPTDTLFVGDLGMNVTMGGAHGHPGAGLGHRPYFIHPTVLSMPMGQSLSRANDSIDDLPVGPADMASATLFDAFDTMLLERTKAKDDCNAATPGSGDVFIPLIHTYTALRLMGMQQKLLWNCSFRVLHARPGGGRNTPIATPLKSLTELFIVRDGLFGGTPVVLPSDVSMNQKPFIQLEAMHPAAVNHPNYPKLKHLYPMVVDSMGAYYSNGGVTTDLRDPGSVDATLTANHDWGRPVQLDYVNENWATGVNSDTLNCDPFDTAYAEDDEDRSKPAAIDRFRHNSGIEIDLVSELRAVRKRAEDFGLDETAVGGSTWLDLMPTVEDLTDPGDHEIIFVLYTGKFGHQMFDTDTPTNFNPPFCGCHLHAALDVNRPSETRPSSTRAVTYASNASNAALAGLHYGVVEDPDATGSDYGVGGIETNHIP